jgi:sulfur-oxidizing protein SoxX
MSTRVVFRTAAVAFSAALVLGCAAPPPTPQALDAQALAMIKAGFRDQGIAKVERVNQDAVQAACSSDKPPPANVAKRLEAEALATVKWPAGGAYLGDWKAGEALAQNGSGMAWNNPTTDPKNNGGNCYNCHQIDKKEISFGTIGPSLTNYGKLRGVTDPASPASKAIVEYTWGKLYNAKAYVACSNMPRFGHAGILNEDQLRDLMALLLDPKSPVNQ